MRTEILMNSIIASEKCWDDKKPWLDPAIALTLI